MSQPIPEDPVLIAADPKRSVWVAANAGSGKTYALAARVTRLLLAGAKPERILCLTYTKAAAAEMAGRLFDQLGAWAMLPDTELTARIAAIGGNAADAEDLRRARRLFAAALETPGGLKIQTIHSFCQSVLMRFPLEAGVPASFTVLDERTGSERMERARAIVFERAGSGDAPRAAALSTLVGRLDDERIGKILDAGLGADRGKIAAFLNRFEDERERAKALRTAHGAKADDSEQTICEEIAAAFAAQKDRWRDAIAWLASGGKQDAVRAGVLQSAVEAPGPEGVFAALHEGLLTADGTIRARLATKKLTDARPDLLAFLEAEAQTLFDANNRQKAVSAANLANAVLAVIGAVRDVYAAQKRAMGALDYDDLIEKTHALLQNGGAQWVLYKLDRGIDHILIDEAQDTSAAQWDIVEALSDEFFAGEGARTGTKDDSGPGGDERVRTLFAVGDEKQSIFSFQGADPAQFDYRRRFFAGRAAAAGCDFSAVPLPVSRRSAPEILSFVDAAFAAPEARVGLTSDGGAVHHDAFRKDATGMVEFWPVVVPDKTDTDDPWDLRPLDVAATGAPIALLAEKIAAEIAGWLCAGTVLPGKTAPIAPGDIMILLPRRKPFADEIIRKLKSRGVPVAGADRLRLNEQIGVMDLTALGRFVLLPEDNLNLACVLRSPLIGFSEDDLFALAALRTGLLWSELSRRRDETPAYAAAYDFLERMRALADTVPPYEFFARALGEKRTAMLKRLGPETADALTEFLGLALAYERAGVPSLEGFLAWVSGGAAEVKRDMDRSRGEVRVMTVHGAKGLEADIVILPDTTTMPDKRKLSDRFLRTDDAVLFPVSDAEAPPPVLAAKNAAMEEIYNERRRLLYVALTRARERLYVCGFEGGRKTADGSWYRLTETAARTLGRPGAEDRLVFGHDTVSTAPRTAPPTETACAVPDWARTAAPPETPSPRLIRPSDAMGEEEPAPTMPTRKGDTERGTLIHALLARLPDLPPPERAMAARRYLSAHGRDESEIEALVAQIQAILDSPVFAPAFAPGSRAEVGIKAALPVLGPGAAVQGRIDRLAVGKDSVLVVDFKSNRRPPARAEDTPRYYRAQMALYRLALQKIFPDKRIVCALVWTETPCLMGLDDKILDAETKRLRTRLTEVGMVPK